ncbi:unnamed protein product, partial [Owenia fusiformis]
MLKLIALGCLLAFGLVVYGQKIVLECGVDIVVILDISCRITPPNKDILREFMVNFANSLDIGPSDEKVQMGLITFDRFVYDEFFLNTYNSSSEIVNHIERMDIHPFNDKRSRCGGSRTDLALVSAKTLHLTVAKGLRIRDWDWDFGIIFHQMQKIVLIITAGPTFPPSKVKNTIRYSKELKHDIGPKIFVVSLSDVFTERHSWSMVEYSAIASQPSQEFVINIDGFHNLLVSLEEIVGDFCDPPFTPSTDSPAPDPCEKFASFKKSCSIPMSACHPSNRRCCGCPFMFIDPTSKSVKTPFELAYKEGKCLCE